MQNTASPLLAPIKPETASGVVKITAVSHWAFAANDPNVHRGCSECSYDVASDEIDYNWFRYYDPKTGRYITSDPIGLLYDFSDPQLSLSVELSLVSVSATPFNNILNQTYAYVDNNPAIKSDSSGLFSTGFNANWLNTPPTPSQFMAPQPPPPQSSCETRCFKKFAKSVYSSSLAIGAGGVLAGGSGVASLIKHHANSASTISDIFGISSCLHRCKDDDCKK
jgi:hypothetical protein